MVECVFDAERVLLSGGTGNPGRHVDGSADQRAEDAFWGSA